MWFKNIKVFNLPKDFNYTPENLAEQLQQFNFTPCTSAMPMSLGWVSPIELDEAPLVHAALGKSLICLQIEEKVLPASVIAQHAQDKIKEIQNLEDRKLSKREKASIKDQVYFSLIQQAFCRTSRIYAYFDLQKNWLIVNSTNAKKLELFVAHLKKTLDSIELKIPETKKIPRLMMHWLLSGGYPDIFTIEDNAVLEDYNNSSHVIRCRNQDLFAKEIQSIIKDGCVPIQISLNWQDRITFNLNQDFTLTSLKYADVVIETAKEGEAETEAERFDADYCIMTETLHHFITDLMDQICESDDVKKKERTVAV